MIVIDEILTAVNTAMDLAKKHQDKETAEKLIEIYSSILEVKKENEELKKENEELKKKIEALEASNNKEDLELSEEGFYYKVSEVKAGKKLRYCAACYNNTGKLYPITAGGLSRDFFCSNCRMRYNDWQILKL